MKITYRIPTKDQYAFLEVEESERPDHDVRAIREVYDELISIFRNGEGLPVKDFNRCIDSYVKDGKLPIDGQSLWQDMSFQQKTVIDELKKSIKRLNK